MMCVRAPAVQAVLALTVQDEMKRCRKTMRRGVKQLRTGRYGDADESVKLLRQICRACGRCEGV